MSVIKNNNKGIAILSTIICMLFVSIISQLVFKNKLANIKNMKNIKKVIKAKLENKNNSDCKTTKINSAISLVKCKLNNKLTSFEINQK